MKGEKQQAFDPDAPAKRPGVFIETHGCQMNEYDSCKLYKILEDEYDPVSSIAQAELVIINTCSIRDKPEHKMYSTLGRIRELKRSNPQLMLGVGGCVAQQEGQRLLERSPAVDFVFGTHNLSIVPSLVKLRRAGAAQQVAVDYRDEWEELPLGFSQRHAGHNRISAFIAISRGCNKNCTYCVVPNTRGPEVSRPLEEILREARIAQQRGARELVLLGQTVNSYGHDLQPKLKFSQLLHSLAELPRLLRLRFTSPHPQEVREDFFDLIERNHKICHHLHLPLQSGSDRVLKAMNRNYRSERYLKIVEELRRRVPDLALTTDIIVGFPGESEDDFAQTLHMLDLVQYDDCYAFKYSARPGTAAAVLPQQLPEQEKLLRLKILLAKQEQITQARLAGWLNREVEVLLEGPSSANPKVLQGRTSQNTVLNLQEEERNLSPGDLIVAKVTSSARFSLRGQFLRNLAT